MAERLADHVLLDLQVLVDEIRTVGVVGHDAPHMGRSEDDVLGALAVEKRFYRTAVQQIQLGMGAAYEVFVPLGAEVVPDGRADQSPVARHIDFRLFFHSIAPFVP